MVGERTDRCPRCGSTSRRIRKPAMPPGMAPFELPPGSSLPKCTLAWHDQRESGS